MLVEDHVLGRGIALQRRAMRSLGDLPLAINLRQLVPVVDGADPHTADAPSPPCMVAITTLCAKAVSPSSVTCTWPVPWLVASCSIIP